MKRIISILFFFITIFTFGKNNFTYAEKTTYNAYWNGIKVGTVVLEVLPKDSNSDDFTFKMTMKTNSFADKFYSSRQTITSIIDSSMSYSKMYQQTGKEKKKEKDKRVEFDWTNNKIKYYSDKKLSKEMNLQKGMLDPLSIFYFLRNQEMKIGKSIDCNVTDGKRIVNGHAVVSREETIETDDFGEIETFVVEPDLRGLGGVFSSSDDAQMIIWFSQGESRLPVKIRSKVRVGSFTAELVKIEGVDL
ncbi:MAG: DUF3108 domain-containing protein [Fusobacteriaceae bacterium]|jgi:hypothetical protein|nr:DUF3108 domain-containing protein [Fusobacteriaceae bacterium]